MNAETRTKIQTSVIISVLFRMPTDSRQVSLSNAEFEAFTDEQKELIRTHKTIYGVLLKDVRNFVGRCRKEVMNYAFQQSWLRPGMYLVAPPMVSTLDAKVDEWKEELERLVDEAAANLEPTKLEMQRKLGSLYNELDYPADADAFNKKFGVELQFFGHGVPGQLEKIDPEMYAREMARFEERVEQIFSEVSESLYGAALEYLEWLQAKCMPDENGQYPVIREETLQNVRVFFATMKDRNIVGDTRLDAIADQVHSTLARVSTTTLKRSVHTKDAIKAVFDRQVETAKAGFGGKRGRRLMLEDFGGQEQAA